MEIGAEGEFHPLNLSYYSYSYRHSYKNVLDNINKHNESIAKAIQVPHLPKQIQISNHDVGVLFQ